MGQYLVGNLSRCCDPTRLIIDRTWAADQSCISLLADGLPLPSTRCSNLRQRCRRLPSSEPGFACFLRCDVHAHSCTLSPLHVPRPLVGFPGRVTNRAAVHSTRGSVHIPRVQPPARLQSRKKSANGSKMTSFHTFKNRRGTGALAAAPDAALGTGPPIATPRSIYATDMSSHTESRGQVVSWSSGSSHSTSAMLAPACFEKRTESSFCTRLPRPFQRPGQPCGGLLRLVRPVRPAPARTAPVGR